MADTESTAPKLVYAMSIMTTMALVFMVLRFICKGRYGKPVGWDDYILASSWICLALYAALIIASTKHGIGDHIDTINPEDLVVAVKFLFIGEFFAIIAVAISKTSFAVTLLRLAAAKWHRVLIWSVIVTVNLSMWLCAIIIFVQCSPSEKLWDTEVEGTCWDPHIQTDYSVFAGSWSAAMDFVLAVFPWLLIWQLQMKRMEKFGVGVAMSLGILSGITAIIKTTYIMQSGRWSDFTFLSTDLLVWAASESAVIIIAASIPFLRLVVKEVSQKSSTKTRSQAYNLDRFCAYRSGISAAQTRRVVVVEATPNRPDDHSDGSILGDTKARGSGIVRTDEITIDCRDVDLESQNESERLTLD